MVWFAEFVFEHTLHDGERERLYIILEFPEFFTVLDGHDVGAKSEHLTKFYKCWAELFKRFAKRDGPGGFIRSFRVNESGCVQVTTETPLHENCEYLFETLYVLHLPP